jgi:hypothetical protein
MSSIDAIHLLMSREIRRRSIARGSGKDSGASGEVLPFDNQSSANNKGWGIDNYLLMRDPSWRCLTCN